MDKNKQIIDKKQGSWFWLCMRIEGGNNVRLRFCGSLDISWESVSRRFFLCECESLFFFFGSKCGSHWFIRLFNSLENWLHCHCLIAHKEKKVKSWTHFSKTGYVCAKYRYNRYFDYRPMLLWTYNFKDQLHTINQ